MHPPIRLALIALYGASATAVRAETDSQQWLTVAARAALSQSVALQGETAARFGDDAGGLYEIESSLLVGYALSGSTTVWAGYVHNPTYADGNFIALERRARQQVTVDDFARIGTAALSARMRVEQRWQDGTEGTGWRVRPNMRLAIPLGDNRAPTINFTAEPFFNLTTTAFQTTAGLDRLRSTISLGVPVGDAVRLDAGYLNQHRFVRGGEDRGDHVLTASLAFSF